MELIIHRGTHQIGGCATEIKTKHARIFIDFGAELPNENQTESHELKIEGLNVGQPDVDGVFLTHYHGDHIGLISQIDASIPLYMGESAIALTKIFSQKMHNDAQRALARMIPLVGLQKIFVKDIIITPIPADHSAYDAFMFLIEAEGKRILHTGDFRLHGFRGKATMKLLKFYAQNIDILIVEGTQLSGKAHSSLSEWQLQAQLKQKIQAYPYVFMLCASTNIDRLASLYHATPRGRYFVCDSYQKKILEAVAKHSKSVWYQFEKALVYGKNLALKKRGFVMPIRANTQFQRIAADYPDALLIYSMWEGYLDGRSPELNAFVEPFQKENRICYLHASGHASVLDTQQICNFVKPKMGIIPIHTVDGRNFEQLDLQALLIQLNDGEKMNL